MFHIGYDIIEKCNNIELYRPDTVYKVYNCLQLLEDIELNTKEYFYINDIEQIVLHKDKNYIYFAPGLSNIPFTQKNNLILSIKNEKHNISCDKDSTKSRLLVGSLVVSNLNHKNVYRKNDKITIFCNNKSYSSTITDVIIKHGLYIHNQSDIIIHYKFNNTLLDVLNKSNNIYIQSTSNIKKDINIELRLNIKGGSPVLVNEKFNRVPKYFCKIFENNKLIFDDMINSYHIHPLKNNTYDVVITDSLNNTPTISNNNIAINNTSITINLADTIKIQNLLPQSSYSVAPQISTVFNSILQSKLR